jgi:hypothetical protein
MTAMGSAPGPKRRRHYAFDESANESGPAIEAEPTDVQAAVPNDQNEPVERIEDQPPPLPAAFEE